MPFIKIQTSAPQPDPAQIQKLLTQLSAQLAKSLGKPESYVMTAFESNPAMTFGGTFDPTCYLEVKSVGTMTSSQTQTMSRDFCQIVETYLAVPPSRTYIEFADARGNMWGWNNRTF